MEKLTCAVAMWIGIAGCSGHPEMNGPSMDDTGPSPVYTAGPESAGSGPGHGFTGLDLDVPMGMANDDPRGGDVDAGAVDVDVPDAGIHHDPCDDLDGDGACEADDPCPADYCDECSGDALPERCDQLLWEFSYGKTGLRDSMYPFMAVFTATPAGGDVIRLEIGVPMSMGGMWTGTARSRLPDGFSDSIVGDVVSTPQWLGRWIQAGATVAGPASGISVKSPLRSGAHAVTAVVSGLADDKARGFSVTMQLRGYLTVDPVP